MNDHPEVHLTGSRISGKVRFDTVLQMIKATEKRTDKRHGCDADMIWPQFNRITTNYGQAILYNASALNFRRNGLSVES